MPLILGYFVHSYLKIPKMPVLILITVSLCTLFLFCWFYILMNFNEWCTSLNILFRNNALIEYFLSINMSQSIFLLELYKYQFAYMKYIGSQSWWIFLPSVQVEASCNPCPLYLASHKMEPGGKATAIHGEAVCRERHWGLSSSTSTPSQTQWLRARILRGHLGYPSSLVTLGCLYWTGDYKSLISWLFWSYYL